MAKTSEKKPSEPKTSDRERQIRLALTVGAHQPVSSAQIREMLPREYGYDAQGSREEMERGKSASRRKLQRDKKALEGYGLFINVDDQSMYTLDVAKTYAKDVELEPEEASLLRLLGAALLEDGSYPFKDELRMVMVKLSDELELPDLYAATPRTARAARKSAPKADAKLDEIRQALRKHKLLSFFYSNVAGKTSRRTVEPIGCMLFNKHLYLAAYDTNAQAERLFRHDRMEKVQANRQSPSKADFKPRTFDASEYLKLPFQFGEETFTAKLRFDASCAWQTGTLCMQRGSIEQNGDGSATWTVDAADAGKLAGWCAQNGPGIRPLEPQAAVDAYRDGLAAVLANGGAADGRPDGNGGAR